MQTTRTQATPQSDPNTNHLSKGLVFPTVMVSQHASSMSSTASMSRTVPVQWQRNSLSKGVERAPFIFPHDTVTSLSRGTIQSQLLDIPFFFLIHAFPIAIFFTNDIDCIVDLVQVLDIESLLKAMNKCFYYCCPCGVSNIQPKAKLMYVMLQCYL